MDDASLRADCSRCIGLCCVLLAIDSGPLFAFDKAPGEPCRHLDGGDRCAIHDKLESKGCAGCASYDCFGAGQAVTALFAGRSWRDGPDTMRAMYDAFVVVRETNRSRRAGILSREAGERDHARADGPDARRRGRNRAQETRGGGGGHRHNPGRLPRPRT